MGIWQACASELQFVGGTSQQPLIVVGITHPQTCLVLTERLRALRRDGFRVVLIASPGMLLEQTAADASVDTMAIPIERGIAPLHDLLSLWRLWHTLRRLGPDVTEFSTPKAGLLGNLAALLCRVPRRVYLLRGLRLETAKRLERIILRLSERAAAACSNLVLCNSASLRQAAYAERIAPLHKLRVLGEGSSHGVDVQRFAPGVDEVRDALYLPKNAPVIGYVGRLTRDKGVPDLIAAFEQVLQHIPEAYLLLVGWFDASEDALGQELRERIAGHSRIRYTGFVADTAPYYRAMDIMVLPTWREGLPNVVLEAAASGVPVITTTATGARDAVVPEVTGLLVPPGYPEAIAEAVLKLMGDPVRREYMGRAARAWVIQHFVEGYVVERAVLLYRGLVQPEAAANSLEITQDAAAAR